MIEAIVGVAVFSILLAGIRWMTMSTWRTQTKAYGDTRIQTKASEILNAITYGEPGTAPRGLRYGRAFATDPTNSALAFHVTWSEGGTIYDKTITFYLSAGKLYRSVVDYTVPLSIVTSGGTEIADHVTQFALTPSGTVPVGITLTLKNGNMSSFVVKTAVKPRNRPGP